MILRAGRGPPPVSATTTSRPVSSRAIQTRPIRVSATSSAAMTGSASAMLVAVARVRLIRNSARDSRALRAASLARSVCSAARRPMTIPTNRNNSRFSHSAGSSTVIVKRGSTNNASYSRNEANAVADRGARPKHHRDAHDGDQVEGRGVRDPEGRPFDQGDQQGGQRQQEDDSHSNDQASRLRPGSAGSRGQERSPQVPEHPPMLPRAATEIR